MFVYNSKLNRSRRNVIQRPRARQHDSAGGGNGQENESFILIF